MRKIHQLDSTITPSLREIPQLGDERTSSIRTNIKMFKIRNNVSTGFIIFHLPVDELNNPEQITKEVLIIKPGQVNFRKNSAQPPTCKPGDAVTKSKWRTDQKSF